MKNKTLKLKLLGSQNTTYPTTYSPKVLETFDNRNVSGNDQWVTFHCPEFTSLCPMTSQPDFATIIINYLPAAKLVESKSLKIYLFSFRNHGDFHENCVQTICDDLVKLMNPKYIEVIGHFTPRGGIAIYPFSSHAISTKKYQDLLNHRLSSYQPKQSGSFPN
jgi:7-cyano-7-deazaguanine reductase